MKHICVFAVVGGAMRSLVCWLRGQNVEVVGMSG
jgi:hypothetical protein